jgi:general stress protein 26
MVFVILQITNNVKLKAMKNVLLILTLCVGMVACSGGKTKSVAENQQTKKDVVEVLYFHGAQRCATCMAIEKNTKALVETAYAEQLKNGKLVFCSVDITKEEALAERYEVSWSSLILVDYDKSGKERATNLTEFAFGNARTASDKFKEGLSEQITEMLNN